MAVHYGEDQPDSLQECIAHAIGRYYRLVSSPTSTAKQLHENVTWSVSQLIMINRASVLTEPLQSLEEEGAGAKELVSGESHPSHL